MDSQGQGKLCWRRLPEKVHLSHGWKEPEGWTHGYVRDSAPGRSPGTGSRVAGLSE